MGRRKRTNFRDSAYNIIDAFTFFFDRLNEIAISSIEWDGAPKSVDQRFLEINLFEKGMSVFFEDEALGYLALPTATNGKWNVYNVPTSNRAYASNGYNKRLDITNSVIIYNDMLRHNSISVCRRFAKRLADLENTIDVNVRVMKTPILITCSENERLSMENLYKEYDGNAPVIYGSKQLNPNALQVLRTDAPYLADKLYDLKVNIWNEALTYLGIPNVSMQKRERMITDEVNRAQGGTMASRNSRLYARQQAAEQISEMFGLDITPRFRDDIGELLTMPGAEEGFSGSEEEGGGENE